jgi:hypothetical protein
LGPVGVVEERDGEDGKGWEGCQGGADFGIVASGDEEEGGVAGVVEGKELAGGEGDVIGGGKEGLGGAHPGGGAGGEEDGGGRAGGIHNSECTMHNYE